MDSSSNEDEAQVAAVKAALAGRKPVTEPAALVTKIGARKALRVKHSK